MSRAMSVFPRGRDPIENPLGRLTHLQFHQCGTDAAMKHLEKVGPKLTRIQVRCRRANVGQQKSGMWQLAGSTLGTKTGIFAGFLAVSGLSHDRLIYPRKEWHSRIKAHVSARSGIFATGPVVEIPIF